MRYVLDFGSANAGAPVPTWVSFVRLDTLAAVAQPTIVNIGAGQFYFDLDWSTTTATSIAFKATKNGIELSDTISTPDTVLPGATTASPGVSSTTGYSTCGVIVARAATQAGVLNLNPVDQATYDPFTSTDPNVVQMLEYLNTAGAELTSKVNSHLKREVTFTTAGSATTWALPADFVGLVDQTGWDRSNDRALVGPVSSQSSAYLRVLNNSTAQIKFTVAGNRLVFPVAPPDGLLVAFDYVSEFWVQTAASGTGPDADHVTSRTDYVLFDPLLVVRLLKLKFLEAKGFDTAVAYTEYIDRLDVVRGRFAGAAKLSMAGRRRGFRFLSEANIPDFGT